MKKLNNNGITLMALVITIVLLIILASIGTYSGIQVVKSAQFTAFSTELKIMQTQVNKLYDEKRNGNDEYIDSLGETISGKTDVQQQANKVFTASASGITDTSDYKYFDTDTIKSLNIEGVEGEFFVNVDKRSVVSYDGFEYEGKTYYTLEQLPDSLYNVEYNTSQEQPDFDVDYELLDNGKCKISVNNINYNGNINKWKVKYKKENEEDWKQSDNYSFVIDELGNYRVKIANNNTESREKQIMAKSSQLPSEYQQVEYIKSTGTQYIDTGFAPNNNTKLEAKFSIDSKSINADRNYIIGTYSSNSVARMQFSYSKNAFYGWGNQYNNSSTLNIDTDIHYLSLSKDSFLLDNTSVYTPTSNNFSLSSSIYLYCVNTSSGTDRLANGVKIYNCKIHDNNVLIRNFIPCKRKSDNKPGLYDLVNNEFYTNQGTGEFELPYGDYSLPSQYQKIEYLESTGTQYIDTEINIQSGLTMECDIATVGESFVNSVIYDSKDSIYYMGWNPNNGLLYYIYLGNTRQSTMISLEANRMYHIKTVLKNGFQSMEVDGTVMKSTSISGDLIIEDKNLILFGGYDEAGKYLSKMRLGNIKYFNNNDILIRNYIPCKRKSDNKPGLYDLVNNVFYTNQGTGDFIKGDDVVVSDNTNDGMIIIINDL